MRGSLSTVDARLTSILATLRAIDVTLVPVREANGMSKKRVTKNGSE